MIRFRHLRSRVILFFGALLTLTQFSALLLVNSYSTQFAQQQVDSELKVGERVFARLLAQNADKLSQSARVLASDFAFREAVATRDEATMASALENHAQRIGADAMMYVGLDGNVLADTLKVHALPRRFEYPQLLSRSDSAGAATEIAVLSGRGFEWIAVPLRAPLRIGWVVLGFSVDSAFARDLAQLTGLEISFMAADPGADTHYRSLASTLDERSAGQLADRIGHLVGSDTPLVRIGAEDLQVRVIPLAGGSHERVVAVLHRSLAQALSSFERLRQTLIVLSLAGLGVSLIGSIGIALNITRPLSALAEAAARMKGGDYSSQVTVAREDEIGQLASSLNHMRTGIAEREQQILRLAYEDPLTDLANRARFSQQLADAIERAQPEGRNVAIIMMDLDRFKYVNDTLGHGVGDHVLREVAARLSQTCSGAHCISRLGGDEFGVLLTGAAAAAATQTAQMIVSALERPVVYHDQPIDVGASVGIAQFPQHGTDAQILLRNADIAMYVAKRNKSGIVAYDPDYDSSQQAHLFMLGDLRRAIEHNELRLVYQPKVSLSSSNVSAVEALVRWVHPQRGLISPVEFIPFAEHTGYIKAVTRWVLAEAIRQCGHWLRSGIRLQISVNISARDLMNRDLPQQIEALLRSHDVPAVLLCLEITESGFMEDPAHAQRVLDQLSALGLQLAIDDYGTGYSSLSYIMRLPVQELKIDRSFVRGLAENTDLSTIVRSTIELGHNLGMKVVAEGVEDRGGWELLKSLGCDDAQGYYMSPPLDPEALVLWMAEHVSGERSELQQRLVSAQA